MATGRYPFFSRAGWMPFLVSVVVGVLVMKVAGWAWSLPFWLLCLIIVFLYRDPDRIIPPSPLAVVSPADGVVLDTETVHDFYLDRDAKRIRINMSLVGVYSTRSPVEGKVLEPPHGGNGTDRPHGVWLKTDEDDDLVIVMHRGPFKNLPHCYVGFGERVGQGQRCGYIPMGGQVEVYLPCSSRLQVQAGSHVKAGSDVIALLVHK
ncbi:hypothetical protein MNBD_GAMMA15-1225 [hydrothermal vent metagenome]|uniref:Phosphatidylserine decarboxylase n=1 Tax=hydrothermal vent metagenome TaxID=652676 RepID=A0A3B0ZF31_9ZZZZ